MLVSVSVWSWFFELSARVQTVVRHESISSNFNHQALIKQDGNSSFHLFDLSFNSFACQPPLGDTLQCVFGVGMRAQVIENCASNFISLVQLRLQRSSPLYEHSSRCTKLRGARTCMHNATCEIPHIRWENWQSPFITDAIRLKGGSLLSRALNPRLLVSSRLGWS